MSQLTIGKLIAFSMYVAEDCKTPKSRLLPLLLPHPPTQSTPELCEYAV